MSLNWNYWHLMFFDDIQCFPMSSNILRPLHFNLITVLLSDDMVYFMTILHYILITVLNAVIKLKCKGYNISNVIGKHGI